MTNVREFDPQPGDRVIIRDHAMNGMPGTVRSRDESHVLIDTPGGVGRIPVEDALPYGGEVAEGGYRFPLLIIAALVVVALAVAIAV
jgi:hypothetical protein